jgi:hypothetical protein
VPPQVGLTLKATADLITEATVYFTQCSSPGLQEPGASSPITVTGITYTLPLHPVPPNTTPPTVQITAPTPSQVIAPAFFDEYATTLEVMGTVGQHSAIYRLTAAINAHAAVGMVYGTSSTTQQYSGSLQMDQSNGLRAGPNIAIVTAEDFERHVASAWVGFTYQPPALNYGDYVALAAVAVTQAIDGGPLRLTTALPAISENPKSGYVVDVSSDYHQQGKETLVRVFAVLTHAANRPGGALPNVPALATVRPAGCDNDGCALAVAMPPMTAPPPPPNGALPTRVWNPKGITVAPYAKPSPGSVADSLDRDETNLSTTWDFVLLPGWTTQDLTVDVTINDGQYAKHWGQPQQAAVPESCDNTADRQCYNAHRLRLNLHFGPRAAIVVAPMIIRVDGTYTCIGGPRQGQTLTVNHLAPTQQQIDETFRRLNILYPLQVVEGPTLYGLIDASQDTPDSVLALTVDHFDVSQEDFILGLVPLDPRCPVSFGVNAGGTVAGKAYDGDVGAWSMTPDFTQGPFDSSRVDAAHELGHNIGLPHWACENGVTDIFECWKFPIAHGGIGAYGTDIGLWQVLPPGDISANSTPHAHDFMTYGQACGKQNAGVYIYGGGPGCDSGEWVSWYTYGILWSSKSLPGSYNPDDPPALLVSGTIAANGQATFDPVYQVDVNHPIADHITENRPHTIYTLEGFDSYGNVLFAHNFEPDKVDVHTADYGHVFSFREAVPVVTNLARIALLHHGQEIGALVNPAPGQTATVTITAPVGGATWPVGRTQTIAWTASSPAHLPLHALVQYSPDGGKTRVTLGRNITGSRLTINPDELAGSSNGTIYVEVSDGLNMATASSGPIKMAVKAPMVHIIQPVARERIESTMPFTLLGTAFDRQERLTDKAFSWSVDGTVRTTGARLATLSGLTLGDHTLTLTVTDSHGLVGKDSVHVLMLTATGGMPPGGISSNAPIIGLVVLFLLAVMLLAVILRRRSRGKAAIS